MTLDQAIYLLKAKGCAIVKSEGGRVLIRDPNDHHLWLTDDPEACSLVATHLFASKVKPYPFDENTRHVLGERNILIDVTEMAAALDMVSEYEEEYDEIRLGALRTADEPYPMYLWVQHSDGSVTAIEEDRLRELQEGAAAQNAIEQRLVDNPEWLHIYLEYAVRNHCVMLAEGEPLPKWDPNWLEDQRNPPLTAGSISYRPENLPKLPSGEIDYATIESQLVEDLRAQAARSVALLKEQVQSQLACQAQALDCVTAAHAIGKC
jgi:hypothetical protein